MDVEIGKVLTLALLAAVSALAAHRSVGIYHDGLRTSLRDLWSGEQTRQELARYAYGISVPFVIGYALPYSLLTGILVIHIVCLGADVVGVWSRSIPIAVAGGLTYGAVCAAVSEVTASAFAEVPGVRRDSQLLWQPLSYAILFLPAVAAAHQFGRRCGLGVAALTIAVWVSVSAVTEPHDLSDVTPGGLAAAAVALVVVLVIAWRVPTESTPDLAFFDDKISRIRGHAAYLIPAAALIAFAAQQRWLAGDPLQVVMLASDQAWAASFVGLFTVVGMLPVQGMTGLVSGIWNPDGYPDWFAAVGYVSPHPLVAAGCGAAIMVVEVLTLRRAAHVLTRRPGIVGLGHAARDALDTVGEPAMLVGAVLAAMATAGPIGALVVMACMALNEKQRRPVMPIAMPVFAYLGVGIGAAMLP
jgi:hypothetical protein